MKKAKQKRLQVELAAPSPEPSPAPYQLFAHPLLLRQLDALEAEVMKLKARDPVGYLQKNATKRLAALTRLMFDLIPQDPARPEYRQGHTLGAAHSHWFRAKFFQQYRLFFRYSQQERVIVYAWVNDDLTKRAYGSATDAYRVFGRMLTEGEPPSDWDALMKAAEALSQE